MTAPSVPATLSPISLASMACSRIFDPHKHLIKQQVHPNAVSGSASYRPKQIAQAYNATALYNTDITGSGQTIAIVIDTFPATSDLVAFWKTAGVSQSLGNIQFIQVTAGQLPDPSGEETLDMEWSSSIAPGAHVRVYAATDFGNADTRPDLPAVLDDVTNHPENGIHQMSMSSARGKRTRTTARCRRMTSISLNWHGGRDRLRQFRRRRLDSGTDGTGDESGPLQPENPASDPNVTGVGGTTLKLDGNNNESSEMVWNDGSWGASGGGVSGILPGPPGRPGPASRTERSGKSRTWPAAPIRITGGGHSGRRPANRWRHELEQSHLGRLLRVD